MRRHVLVPLFRAAIRPPKLSTGSRNQNTFISRNSSQLSTLLQSSSYQTSPLKTVHQEYATYHRKLDSGSQPKFREYRRGLLTTVDNRCSLGGPPHSRTGHPAQPRV